MSWLRNRFVRNAATLQAGALVNGAGGFTTALLLAHLLGARLQGEYYTVVALYSGLALLVNFGLVQITVNMVAAASARKDHDEVADSLAFLAKGYFLLGLLLPVAGWVGLPFVVRLVPGLAEALGAHGAPGSGARVDPLRLAALLTFTPLLELPKQVVAGALQGTRRMVLLAKAENGAELVRVFAVTAGTVLTFTPLGPVLGLLLASGVGSIVSLELYRVARRDAGYPLPPMLEVLRRAPRAAVLPRIPITIRLGAMRNLDSFALEVMPVLFMRAFASAEWAAYFKIATRIMNVPLMVMQGVSRTALPAMSELKGLADMGRFRRSWTRVTLYGGGIVAGGLLLALPLVPPLTRVFYPDDYVEPVWTIALILAVGFVPSAFCIALDTFYLVVDRLGVLIRITLVGLALIVPLTLLLCWWLPDTGAAWGYTVTKLWALLNFLYVAHYFRSSRGRRPEPSGGPATP